MDKNYTSNTELTNYNDDYLRKSNVMFFDNDSNNFNGFNDSINILIDDKIPNELVQKNNISKLKPEILQKIQIPFAKMVQEINNSNNHNNKYINALVSYNMNEKHMPVEGFTERHINIVNKWINAHGEKNDLYLLFDWDRTLSVCEGIVFMNDKYIDRFYTHDTKQNILPDILNLLIGSQARYDMLKSFFNEICEIPNLHILVITANPSAQKSNINYRNFFEMVKLLIPCLTEERFLCSSSSSKSIEFNKYRSDSIKHDDSIEDGDSIKHDGDSKKRKGSFNEGNVKKSRKVGGRKNRTKKSKRTKRRHK